MIPDTSRGINTSFKISIPFMFIELVESRGAIMLRPSLLDRSVRISSHCAPEYL